MLTAMGKKSPIKRILKGFFIGFSIFFIVGLFLVTLHDSLTGGGVTTPVEELCANYGFLASPECW
jgi:hypothetical protein